MADNLIELIKVLRDRTGAGLMDCKGALLANDNDIEKATDWLREKGLAKAAKKADRIAAEGLAITHKCESCGKVVVLEVNCETDFVAKGDAFHDFVDAIAVAILKNDCKTVEDAKNVTSELFGDATVKMGEKFDLRRFTVFTPAEGHELGTYIHMGGKIAVVCDVKGANAELAKQLAMHIAANNPQYITLSDVPADVLDREKAVQMEIAKQDPKLASKPAEFLGKILEGKINKHFAEMTLASQAFLMDDTKTVGQVLSENKAELTSFIRYAVGEGIEKRQDDFAAEVAAQSKM